MCLVLETGYIFFLRIISPKVGSIVSKGNNFTVKIVISTGAFVKNIERFKIDTPEEH